MSDLRFPTARDISGRRIDQDEIAAAERVLRSGRLNSAVGEEVKLLEQEFASIMGTRHAVASSSGSSAIHAAVMAINPSPGDEIVTSPLSDVGTILGILAQNAVPVFADVDPLTGNLDPASVQSVISDRTRAIIVVHLFGTPANVAELSIISRDSGIVLVEDCAQAYFCETEEGRLAGTVGDIGCFSLQQWKHATAGEGGLCVTDSEAFADRLRLVVNKGVVNEDGERVNTRFGLNYRLSEIQAAVARVQINRLRKNVDDRRLTAGVLSAFLGTTKGIAEGIRGGVSSYWMYPMLIDSSVGLGNDVFAKRLALHGIPAFAGYYSRPLYLHPILQDRKLYGRSNFPFTSPPARRDWRYEAGLCPIAESLLSGSLLTIGWNENFTDDHVGKIVVELERILNG